ncbi:MAG TPA: adenylate/guanylate cyclase domain-containing protein [Gemmatimonadota bacterium]|nr:adenylate/guanylate cyclase domain-containing protein [Gemmatimonadota bacterium]
MPACRNCGYESDGAFTFCPECGTKQAAAAPFREQRKTVTVLFCDLTGSTSLGETLDPERLRAMLARYFERMKVIVERHGGSVEKFIGDAVMAVFGVPVVHEDDARRAVRSALEMRDALPELGLQGRIGIMTGEVVTGTGERLATGDAVNVAARLEQAAPPGEVLIGKPTLALVRDVAEFEELEALMLKGKAEPVPAYRLLRVLDAPEQRYGAPFVGRDRELEIIGQEWVRIQAERRCGLTTLIGEAGVGKSRLAAEFLASIEATVARGRCPPYGEGITYWPVVEVVRKLNALPPDETAAEAIRTLLRQSQATTSSEEIAWAFRKTLEHASAERPLVVVFDDIQWGEQTFLDLVEHVALLSSDASILLLCLARPDLSKRRPTWPVTLRLEPLGDDDVERLIAGRVADELGTMIARAAGGNPLFIEEMLAMTGDADGEVVVPPTLHALLGARLDQLETAERTVLELGAIEGEVFHRGAVQALAPNEIHVTPHLAALVRKELIRTDTPQLAGEDGFRFRHLLIRDAAYDALSKATRADLHVRFASWLEQNGTELVELDEILGYHLEQACGYRAELGMPDDEEMEGAAHRHLSAAGFRAHRRQDYGAAVSLLERAAALLPPAEVRDLALEAELSDALVWTGRANEAQQRADALTQRSSSEGDRVGELCGRIWASMVGLYFEPEGATEKLSSLVEQALPVFQAGGDELALYVGYAALSEVEVTRGRIDAALEAYEQALTHARRAGHLPPNSFGQRAYCRFAGTTPVLELLAWLDQNEGQEGRDYFFRAYRASALAMLGRFDEARAILTQARAELAERGGGVLLANITAFESVWVERWAGDPAAAAEFGADGFRLHEEHGEQSFLSSAAANLAQALYELDRLDEADDWASRAAGLGASEDAWKEVLWRQVRAKVFARRGGHADAERLALEAVAICEATDMLNVQGDVYADLAEVLLLGGRMEEAAEALEQALARYEQKGTVVMAARTRSRLMLLEAKP